MEFGTHGNISEEMEVTNTSDWLQKQGIDPDSPEWEDNPVLDLVGKMIALDIAIYTKRRTAYACGSNTDYLRALHHEQQTKYFELTGEHWDDKDFNKDIDW